MVELYSKVREGVISEATTAYRKLTAEEAEIYHKAVGLYEMHPAASFIAGAIVALLLVWWL